MSAVDPDVDDTSPWLRDDWTGTEAPRLDVLSTLAPSVEPTAKPANPANRTANPAHRTADPAHRTATQVPPSEIGGLQNADVVDGPVTPRRRGGRIAAVVVVAGVLAIVAVVLLRGDDPGDPADDAAVADVSNPPVDTVAAAVPGTTLDSVAAELAARSAAEERVAAGAVARSGAAGGLTPAVAVAGEAPAWTEWTVEPAESLARIDPATEVVTLTNAGVLHRLVLPSGEVRSIVVPEPNRDWKLAVGGAAVVVYDQRDIVVFRDDRPVQRIETQESVLFVQPWPSTSSYIVTMTASPALDAERMVLDADTGATRPLAGEVADALRFGAASFLASGELLVERAGGIYAIGPDQQARQLDVGGLLAVGRHHYGVETCDDALQCADFVVDVRSGERTPAELTGLAPAGFVDPSSHISPDGRSVVFTDATRSTGFRQILDTGNGDRFDIGRLRGLYSPDTWATDSSGVFLVLDGSLWFQTRRSIPVAEGDLFGTVEVIELDEFGAVDDLGVRPA